MPGTGNDMILDIFTYPHPVLRKISVPVDRVDDEIRELAANMLETMYAAKGVGLAAPQIGKNLRMLVMDPGSGTDEQCPKIVINPELELTGASIVSEQEGCLSVPMGYRADVQRSSCVNLKYLDVNGNTCEEILEGFPAIIIQHENDHLDGKLFIDKMSHLRRTLYDSKVKKWLKQQN